MTERETERAVAILGLLPSDLRLLSCGQAGLDLLRKKAHSLYKKAAFALHPDTNGGDTSKTEDFVLVRRFVEELDRMVPPLAEASKKRRRVRFRVRVLTQT
jgi:hypothetical protein